MSAERSSEEPEPRQIISPELLVRAYSEGIFPMAMETGEIGWFSPPKRGILPLETFHVPHGLKRALRKNRFNVRWNGDFVGVMRHCAERSETWISGTIIASYAELNRLGMAHSVECWLEGRLVGGLYGVSLGAAFFGESMFHRETDASKVALVALVERMKACQNTLLDTQWITPHLKQFGATEIPRHLYLARLKEALGTKCPSLAMQPET